jgi:hypothetical protein
MLQSCVTHPTGSVFSLALRKAPKHTRQADSRQRVKSRVLGIGAAVLMLHMMLHVKVVCDATNRQRIRARIRVP